MSHAKFLKSISFILFCTLCVSITSAKAADMGRQSMIYQVYAGGLHAVQIEMNVDTGKNDRYDFDFTAHTRGLLADLVPWYGTYETHGWQTKQGLQPELHKSSAFWRDEPDIKEYHYGKDGSFKSLITTDKHTKGKVEDFEPALAKNTTDALTATLMVMEHIAKEGKCEGSSEIFDGDRRYKLVFNDKGSEQLQPTRYNVYDGLASQCTVEVVPDGGKWHEKPRGWMSIQEQGRQKGTMPTVWFAKLQEGGPAVPVKVRVKTEYGTFFMHMSQYQNAQGTRIAQKD